MDVKPFLFSMKMRLKIPEEITTNTKNCFDYAGAIIKDENDKQLIPSWIDTDILLQLHPQKIIKIDSDDFYHYFWE